MSEKSPEVRDRRMIRTGRLSGSQRNRLGRLLNMMYTTIELAGEIGVSPRLIRQVYVPLGCPHTRNQQNHIMINGRLFRDWYQGMYTKPSLEMDEAFCLTCRDAVKMADPLLKELNGLSYKVGKCPNCGRNLARFMDMDRKRS